MSAPNVVVVGSSKTGTTGLYGAVWESLSRITGGQCYGLREQDDLRLLENLQRLAPDRVLAGKFLLTSQAFSDALLAPFDRHLMTVRDPRDTLLSAGLFYGVTAATKGVPDEQIADFIDLVRKKEAAPDAVDFLEIFRAVHALMGRDLAPGQVPLRRFRVAIRHAAHHDPYVVRYERFVRDDLDDVSEYLGFEVRNVRPSDNVSFVVRSGTEGEWRHWFTERDVETLRPMLEPYMRRFGYPDDWELAADPEIDPRHGSGYIQSAIATRRDQIGLVQGEGTVAQRIEHLRQLAAAGSVRDASRVALLLEEQDAEGNAEEIREQLWFAAAGGSIRAMRRLSALLERGPAHVRDPRQARRWRLEARVAARGLKQAREAERLRRQQRRTRRALHRLRQSRRVRLATAMAGAARGGPKEWLRLPARLWGILRA